MTNLKLTFYGGVGSTTGANIMLEVGSKSHSAKSSDGTRKILVDCGLLQGRREKEEKNFEPFKYNPAEVNFLLITHAHMDHIGRIPKLVKDGFKGQIISTEETMELARPMLADALKVLKSKHPNKTLFEEGDIEKSFSLWQGRKYVEKIELFENCSLKMQNAGHILGSAILNISCGSTKLAFTGDLGNSPSPLLPDNEFPNDVDYIVMESVYGDRNHENRKERREKLKQALLEGIKKDGAMVIPAFSIERTQVLLYEINNMIEDKEIKAVPVFLDSPLALKVTDIYKKHIKEFKESVKEEIKAGDDIFDFPNFNIIRTAQESREIEKINGAKIILAGSGMSEGGRIVNHEAHYLPDPKATIIMVGYQSVGSLGRAILDGKKEVEITPPTPSYIKRGQDRKTYRRREKVKVRATIKNITGYSSHKDSEHLLEFVEAANTSPLASRSPARNAVQAGGPLLNAGEGKKKLKKVFVIMGEPKSSLFLTQRIRDYLDINAIYPEEGRVYNLV